MTELSLLTAIPKGITAFCATNLDDILILLLFFTQVNASFRRVCSLPMTMRKRPQLQLSSTKLPRFTVFFLLKPMGWQPSPLPMAGTIVVFTCRCLPVALGKV